MNREIDVLILGGGPVGLSLAAALARSRLKVGLLDIRPAPRFDSGAGVESLQLSGQGSLKTGFDANVLAISPASREFLEEIDAWRRIPAIKASAYLRMRVADSAGAGTVEFLAKEEGLPELGHIVEQSALSAALSAVTSSLDNVETKWGTSFGQIKKVADGYRLVLPDGEELRPRLLVGADGGASPVREATGLRTWGRAYGQRAVVCLAKVSGSHRQTAWQWFAQTGPLAFLPLSHEQLVAVVWSATDSEDLLSMTDRNFSQALTDTSEGELGEVEGVTSRASFPLVHRHALNYVRPGVAILGDAAHSIHPLAGQGANLGFADAGRLAFELSQALVEGRSPGDLALLRRYEAARRRENIAAGMLMEGFHRLFSRADPVTGFLRNRSLTLVNGLAPLKSLAVGLAAGKGPLTLLSGVSR